MNASAAIIRFSDLDGLGLRALYALALQAARDVDAGADKRHTLEKLMAAIKKKGIETCH
jgi:hypothetical protein